MEKLRVGIIGTGNIANTHIAAYRKNPDAELCALCDIDEKQLKSMGEKYGITHLYTDMNEMFANEKLDAVSVCTWNSAHAPCTIAALKAGINVLCEKPMAISEQEALEMKKTAEECGKLLMIGFVRRHGADCKILQEFIRHDHMGEIYYAKTTCLRRDGNPGGWFGDKSRSGGGPLIDLGVHMIDLVRYLSGKPKPVSVYGVSFQKLFNRKGFIGRPKYLSAGATDHDVCDVEDLASAMIRFDNGEVLIVETAFSLNMKEDVITLDLYGTKAGAQVYPNFEIYDSHYNYLSNLTLDVPTATKFEDMFVNEIQHFTDCIRGQAECIAPAEDGVELMRILDAVYESARVGHEVILS